MKMWELINAGLPDFHSGGINISTGALVESMV